MRVDPGPTRRHGPPPRRATAGDTAFALGVAALGLVLAGGILAAAGGGPLLSRLLPGVFPPTPTPAATLAAPSPAASPIGPTATEGPTAIPSPTDAPPPASDEPAPTDEPAATPTTPPAAGAYSMNLYRKGVFVHQADKDWCVAAAAQNMLNVIRLVEEKHKPDTSTATQRALYRRITALTTWDDSHNGGTGPGGWAALLTEEGYPYEVRVYDTRNEALTAAVEALRATRRPVGILAWGGVHSWVLTGFKATADPASGRHWNLSTAYVIDPWYPWVSTRWPRSERPNAPRDAADLRANVRPWNLASGPYEGRDGKYLLIVPVKG